MENFEPKLEKKIRAELAFGLPGHEWEYTFVIDSNDFLSSDICESLELELGEDWDVSDRGNRIEIRNKKELGLRDDEKIKTAIEKTATDKYNLRLFL